MVEYDNTNRGVLFKNKDKDGTEETEKWADYKGQINVEGEEFWLNAWIKKSEKGTTYMSLGVKKKEPRARGDGTQTKEQKREEFNDEIPF